MAFGRPKTYPHIHDVRQLSLDPAADANVLKAVEENPSPHMLKWLAEHRELLVGTSRRFFVRQKAQFTDPRVVFHVIDATIRTTQNTYIRPRDVAHHLNVAQTQYRWGAGTVGRILAGLSEHCRAQYGYGNADGIEYEQDERFMPFSQARDTQGLYYVIDPKGGNEGRLWLMQWRGLVQRAAEQQQLADEHGDFKAYFAKSLNANEALVTWGASAGPIRTYDAYVAQTKDPRDPALDTQEMPETPVAFSQPGDVRLGR